MSLEGNAPDTDAIYRFSLYPHGKADRRDSIIVADSDLFALNHASPEQGVRLALGGVRTREALADALGTLAGMLHG